MERPYVYYDFTLSLCSTCLRRVDAKIIFDNDQVFMLKRCPEHGTEKTLIATDVEYYRNTRNYAKRREIPRRFNTRTHFGCPYDCGLCPDHEQHSCLTIVEVTDRCNLTCPVCYAACGCSTTASKNQLVCARCHLVGLACGMDWMHWSSTGIGAARAIVVARTVW